MTPLQKLIETSGYRQDFIARQTGIHEAMISRYKYGLRIPAKDLTALAKFFKVRPAEIEHKHVDEYSAVS
jgi:transcriptional regulator with XRE-family HTH domain